MKIRALLVIALLAWGTANADEVTRKEKIANIIEAQGLMQMFQQQLDQSKASAGDLGKSIAKKLISESKLAEEQVNPKFEAIFSRYMERTATMFSAKEFVDTWTTFYGKNLLESELDQILAYYQSPVGKKDVLASQVAMVGFGQTMSTQMQERLNASIAQLMSDLRASLAK